VNCERLLKRSCPLIEHILLLYRTYTVLSYDGSLTKQARLLVRESAEMARSFLMMRGIFIEQ